MIYKELHRKLQIERNVQLRIFHVYSWREQVKQYQRWIKGTRSTTFQCHLKNKECWVGTKLLSLVQRPQSTHPFSKSTIGLKRVGSVTQYGLLLDFAIYHLTKPPRLEGMPFLLQWKSFGSSVDWSRRPVTNAESWTILTITT